MTRSEPPAGNMRLSIALQNIFTPDIANRTENSEVIWSAIARYAGQLETQWLTLEQRFTRASTNQVYSRFGEQVNAQFVAAAIREAEGEGFDAATVICFAEPGVDEARSLVDIPVTGPLEEGLNAAALRGDKTGAICVVPEVVGSMTRRIRHLGVEGRCISRPVRALDHWSYDALIEQLTGRSDTLIEEFDVAARKCIEDGAETVIVGCAFVAVALTLAGHNVVEGTETPIIDSVAAAIFGAAAQAQLRRATGVMYSRSPYAAFHKEAVDSEVELELASGTLERSS